MRQRDHYKFFMKHMQKTTQNLLTYQMASCEKVVKDSAKIKSTSELE